MVVSTMFPARAKTLTSTSQSDCRHGHTATCTRTVTCTRHGLVTFECAPKTQPHPFLCKLAAVLDQVAPSACLLLLLYLCHLHNTAQVREPSLHDTQESCSYTKHLIKLSPPAPGSWGSMWQAAGVATVAVLAARPTHETLLLPPHLCSWSWCLWANEVLTAGECYNFKYIQMRCQLVSVVFNGEILKTEVCLSRYTPG